MTKYTLLLLTVAVACGLNLKRGAGNEQTLAHSSTLKRVARLAVDPDSARPLRRIKRRWVLTTIEVEEGDPGPFPKFAANLFNDKEANITIKYLISGPGVDENPRGYFSVDDKTGEVYTLKTIDREATPTFVIKFDVADRRTGKIVDRSLVFNIDVKDKNDNAPKFKQPVVDVRLKENTPAGSDVILLQAEDIDKRGTPNSEFSYSVVSQEPSSTKNKFNINLDTGIVSFEGCLDYQSTKSYKILVEAKDHGEPQLSSTATVNVKIEDANNNPPVFVKEEFTGSVKEQQVGVPVLRVSVEDKDTPNTPAWRAKYTIAKGNKDGNFKIETDPQTNDGVLTVIKPMDYEKGSRNELVILVENEEPLYICPGVGGSAPAARGHSVPVVVNVEDVNDPPHFEHREITFYQTEGTKAPIQLGKVHAVDPDAAHSTLRYEIPAGSDPAKWLTIDKNTGEVTAISEMDRESPSVNNSIYSVIVLAIDDGKPPETGTATVFIHLMDVNDNNPFLVSKYLHMCDDPKSTSILVKAVDKDIEPYSGPFNFQLLDKGNVVTNTWKLEQAQGESIKLLRLRELPPGNYTVPLKIFDQQGLSAEEDLVLRICECSQEGICRPLEAQSANFGGAAIGALIGALLLMLLLLLCCMLCDCGGKMIREFPPGTADEGNQTLIKYNDEGGGCPSQASSSVIMPLPTADHGMTKNSMQTGQCGNGFQKRCSQDMAVFESDGVTLMLPVRSSWGLREDRMYGRHTETARYSRTTSLQAGNLESERKNLQEKIATRLYALNGLDANFNNNELHFYAEEGELHRLQSLDNISIADSRQGLDFLNDLGLKFSMLGRVCQEGLVQKGFTLKSVTKSY
ncbi:cadherin-like protein 26 isoform X2 [Polyodon spathula]|uniref:cadherin-like protein 26 isoform X2 n=1 Tax=Polyodon spathula TaxID=7913 RepID=UPI001B7E1710|nr:cadherin-like protein 26 isoform X2 [Polyodon spathula]